MAKRDRRARAAEDATDRATPNHASAGAAKTPLVDAPAELKVQRSTPAFSPFRSAQRPTGSRYDGPVFGIGRQAFVNGQGLRRHGVPLTDEMGAAVGSLADGTEVEITAWIPRGVATRYRVRTTGDGREGWLRVADLRVTRKPTAVGAVPKKASPPVSIPPKMPVASSALRPAEKPLLEMTAGKASKPHAKKNGKTTKRPARLGSAKTGR